MLKTKKAPVAILLTVLLLCMALLPNAAAATTEQKVEVTTMRDSSSKTYKRSDGSYEWVGYAEDVHYLDKPRLDQAFDMFLMPLQILCV